jgi:hypothetical protein
LKTGFDASCSCCEAKFTGSVTGMFSGCLSKLRIKDFWEIDVYDFADMLNS